MTTWAEISARIAAGDATGVVRAFAGLSEPERRDLASDALACYREDDLNVEAGLAVLATATRADADRLWPGVVMRQPDLCVELLAERRPGWLDGWLTRLCERNPGPAWRVAHPLRRRGLYTGDTPAYALAFIAGVGGGPATYDLLREDPSLLDDELWQAFQIEGGGETSFAAHDKYTLPAYSWSATLRRLAEERLVDRGRLIDATLDALARGYSAFRAGWFIRFHDELALSDDERRARVDRYLELLGSPTAQVQSFAVRAAAAVARLEPVPATRLVDALRPAVLNRAKATAVQALRLVEAAAQREPRAAAPAALVAAEALLHEAPDVQGRALALVERYAAEADGRLAATLAAAAPVVAPSLRARLELLVGDGATTVHPPAPPSEPAAWPSSILEAAVLDSHSRLERIETAAELALAVARTLEHPEEVDGFERALDGVSRLCAAARAEPASIWAPIRKRCERHLRDLEPFQGNGIAVDFAGLVAAWLDGEPPERAKPPATVAGFLSARMHAIAGRVAAGDGRPLLSTPTHAGGWIDAEVLVSRFERVGEPADTADLVLALLRLAPERREVALEAAGVLPGEAGAALRFALGGEREKVGRTREVWVAAARARCPGRDAPDLGRAFRRLGAGAERIARPLIAVERRESSSGLVWHHLVVSLPEEGAPPSELFPTVALHASEGERARVGYAFSWLSGRVCGSGATSEADVRWCATLHPADLDPLYLEGLERIGNNLDWWTARWEDRAYLEPLLATSTRLSDLAVRLLTVALAAKEPGIRGLATDATARALADGRLAADELGAALADAWPSALFTPRRFALSLAAAAGTSAEHRHLVRHAVVRGFRARPHADAASLLELLHELCHADGVGVDDVAARTSLAELETGKAGRLAKSLLAL